MKPPKRLWRQRRKHRRADEEREGVLVLSDQAREPRHVRPRRIDGGLRLPHAQLRGYARVETVLDELVRGVLVGKRLAREIAALAVGGERQVRVAHFGDEADLDAAASFLGREEFLQGLIVEASHAAEQVELVRAEADVRVIHVEGVGLAAARKVRRHALGDHRGARVRSSGRGLRAGPGTARAPSRC